MESILRRLESTRAVFSMSHPKNFAADVVIPVLDDLRAKLREADANTEADGDGKLESQLRCVVVHSVLLFLELL